MTDRMGEPLRATRPQGFKVDTLVAAVPATLHLYRTAAAPAKLVAVQPWSSENARRRRRRRAATYCYGSDLMSRRDEGWDLI
uniref:Uncharacterized protein n=1 Tax=Ipomoea trifida TaxID=35884 RepID=A0A910_IPOTF|nr:hypothetical protein [Ipomoea trifida]